VRYAESLQHRRQCPAGGLVLVADVVDPSAATHPLQKALDLVDEFACRFPIVEISLARSNRLEVAAHSAGPNRAALSLWGREEQRPRDRLHCRDGRHAGALRRSSQAKPCIGTRTPAWRP
jgi:hypothetical protein